MVWRFLGIAGISLGLIAGAFFTFLPNAQAQTEGSRLVTVYDKGERRVFMSQEKTIGKALEAQGFVLDKHDAVEPSVDEEMVAPDYRVNIYRARAVIIRDGPVRAEIMTPYQSTEKIIKDAGIELYPEDKTKLSQTSDFINDGIGLTLTISRAKEFTFDLYGKKQTARTHAGTVREMLNEKSIKLGKEDRLSVELEARITPGIQVRVWREGKQTIAEDQPISFASEIIYDADRPLGYRAIKTKGVAGVRSVTYEVEIKDGNEVYRKQIAQLTTREPKSQQLSIGIKGLESGLSRSKGALHFKDSKGVVHRETYYDLPMRVVMGACGQGGVYTVRFDGMKIDADGYIIIAANYAKYPKCSVVETSAGPGKVYDTGGFVLKHPDGFDLATDWTRADGI